MSAYQAPTPTREEIDAAPGPVLLDFGTNWCGYCQAAAPHVETALRAAPAVRDMAVRHIKVEDGPGRALGRSFRVKLWPTLIALQDGVEVARSVRPTSEAEIAAVLARLG